MRTTYGRRRDGGRTKQKNEENRRQLVQLLVCLVLFLVVFVGKEVWPSKIAATGEAVLAVIRTNTDFKSAFFKLGRAITKDESILDEFGDFCISVFAPNREEQMSVHEAAEQITEGGDQAAGDFGQEVEFEEEKTSPQIGAVLERSDNEAPLPEGNSGQHLYLGQIDTATPVLGVVTSSFGYRDHPTIGRYAAHGGVDIAADAGTEVAAFAAGTVESVGEDQDFGLWLRLSHANGVSSFYAHCSEICVKESEVVEAGQQVARVGSSGKSTGPHLHFEISLNGERLDPMHYISPGGTR